MHMCTHVCILIYIYTVYVCVCVCVCRHTHTREYIYVTYTYVVIFRSGKVAPPKSLGFPVQCCPAKMSGWNTWGGFRVWVSGSSIWFALGGGQEKGFWPPIWFALGGGQEKGFWPVWKGVEEETVFSAARISILREEGICRIAIRPCIFWMPCIIWYRIF